MYTKYRSGRDDCTAVCDARRRGRRLSAFLQRRWTAVLFFFGSPRSMVSYEVAIKHFDNFTLSGCLPTLGLFTQRCV